MVTNFEFSQPLLSTLKKCNDCEKYFCPIQSRTAMHAQVNDDDEDEAARLCILTTK